MKRRCASGALLFCLLFSLRSSAQLWTHILRNDQAINWTETGVGAIPARPVRCASLGASSTVQQINRALSACGSGKAVYLEPGTYTIAGTISVPSHVTLRGAGADLTVLNATGASGGTVVSLGSAGVPFRPVALVDGSGSGSTTLQVNDPASIRAGDYLAIAEQNDATYVSSAGTEGNCNWCDSSWTSTGQLARGQIVRVTGVTGDIITISPGLYSSYTHAPVAVQFAMSATEAGVEDLQVRANHTGYSANFGMSTCAYCWLKGVESNYTDGDHVEIYWGFHDEVRDSYFSNAFLHTPGAHDSDIQIASKTSATLIENNIIERNHESVMLEWGAAGNVVAYNYMMGEFDSGADNVVIGGINFHGAHPQFNLIEGNVVTQIYADSVWGTSSHTTAFRNWIVGTSRICDPINGRAPVRCAGASGHYGFQAARAVQLSFLATRNNFVANLVGSEQMQSLTAYGRPMTQLDRLEFPADRSYDTVAIGWSFGYGELGDTGNSTPCENGVQVCHAAGTSATDFLHGNFSNIDGTTGWQPGVTKALPASFYLSSKPAWWGGIPFPAIGPDIKGGAGPGQHSYENPAEACYFKKMGGTDGGAGGPRKFNAEACYGTSQGTEDHRPSATH